MRTKKFAVGLLLAVAMFGGGLVLFLSHTSAQQTRVIHLVQGWNSVAWTGEKQFASEALADLGDAVSAVYGYDNDSHGFTRYMVGRPEVSTLTDFEPEQAYWVLAQRSADWSVPGPAAPSCPTVAPCLTPTPCPYCPAASSAQSEYCASLTVAIELSEILVDIAEEGLLIGATESEVRAQLTQARSDFDQQCQGLPLAEPSLLALACAAAGKWKGLQEGIMVYSPHPQTMVWINQFDDIIDNYCTPH